MHPFLYGPKCKKMAVIIHSSSYAPGSLQDSALLNIYNDIISCILNNTKDTELSVKVRTLLSEIYQRGVAQGLERKSVLN